MSETIGICLGDITGIGPEVTLKAIASELSRDAFRYLLIGDARHLTELNRRLGSPIPLASTGRSPDARVSVHNAIAGELPKNLTAGHGLAADAAIHWLREAATRCLAGELAAMVTAPVNKNAIIRAGHRFIGQTEFLAELSRADRTAMMLLGQDERGRWLRVALVTTHLPLREVAQNVTAEKISLAIELAAKSCSDLGLTSARVAVCGLNPHAGEGGQMGDEERTIISPTVQSLQQKGMDVVGPLSGDTVFHHALRGEYDAVVAMYHDQGLAPLKAVAFDTGVNWTLGLPFIRTSPDHGTAYDIAGRGIACASSMVAALRLAKQLATRRRRSGKN